MFRNPTTDLIVVLVIVLLILGPKRLPGLGRSLGTGMKEFKDSITGDSEKDEEQATLEAAPAEDSAHAEASGATPRTEDSATAGTSAESSAPRSP